MKIVAFLIAVVPVLVSCTNSSRQIAMWNQDESKTKPYLPSEVISKEGLAKDSIYVQGFLIDAFENTAIYDDKFAAENHEFDKALWVRMADYRGLEPYAGKSVVVKGALDLSNKGHMDVFGGEIRPIDLFLLNR